jgi:hypothetical protein
LLIDQGGSMMPFHRFTRDVIATVGDPQQSRIEQVDVAYFHNVPAEHVFADPHLTQPLLLRDVLRRAGADACILLVSDAGAARGLRRIERIRATAEFLSQLGRRAARTAWLNPMPEVRWVGSSAEFIARLAPMFQMDKDGFDNAIAALRGQWLRRRH